MDELKKTKVTSIIEKLAQQSQEGISQLQMLRADIARYEEALQKYSDFKDAEDFLMDGKRQLSLRSQVLDDANTQVEADRTKLVDMQKTLDNKVDQLNKRTNELDMRELALNQREALAKQQHAETSIMRKRADEQTEVLGNWERKLSERESLFNRRYQALKTLMETV